MDFWVFGDFLIKTLFQKLIIKPNIIDIKINHKIAQTIEKLENKIHEIKIKNIIKKIICFSMYLSCNFFIKFAQIAEKIQAIAKRRPIFSILIQICSK